MLLRLVDDAVERIAAGETDVAGVARGGEQTGGQLGRKVREEGAWRRGGGSELGGCVEIVAAALLGKVTLGFGRKTCTAVALVPEKEAHGWGEAFAVSFGDPVASAIDAGACTCAGVRAPRWIVAGGLRVSFWRIGFWQYYYVSTSDLVYEVQVRCGFVFVNPLVGFGLVGFGCAAAMELAPRDQLLHSPPITTAAHETRPYADTLHVLREMTSACTHGVDAWELGIVRRFKARNTALAFDRVEFSSFDPRDGESCCGGGSTGVMDEGHQR